MLLFVDDEGNGDTAGAGFLSPDDEGVGGGALGGEEPKLHELRAEVGLCGEVPARRLETGMPAWLYDGIVPSRKTTARITCLT